MKTHFRIIFFLVLTCHVLLKSQNYRWEMSIGGKSNDGGGTILSDANGNIYSLGFFNDTVDFDPGPGVANLISTNGAGGDTYILKLDSNGNFVWVKGICAAGLTGFIGVRKMALDKMNNIYLTGNFSGQIDFDPGSAVVTLTSTNSMFILKLNSSGDFLWAKGMGGIASYGTSWGLAVDTLCNIYYTGMYRGGYTSITPSSPLLDFDPSPSIYTIAILPNQTPTPFISKLDSAGNFLWAKHFNGTTLSAGGYGWDLVSDNSGNIFSSGFFHGIVDFDPGPNVHNVIAFGNNDVFISKLDVGGNFVWLKQMGGINDDYCTDITLDSIGNIFTCGQFDGVADFDPGSGIHLQTTNGSTDVFISKLDSGGNYLWSKSFGGLGPEYCSALCCDKSGNIYTTGAFSLTLDFDPGSGTNNLSCNSWYDMFISKLDGSGNFVWAKTIGGMDSLSFTIGNSISLDKDYNVYTSGQYHGTVDFNPDYGVSLRTTNGKREAFISKLGVCNASLNITPTITLCIGNSHTLSANGSVNYTWNPGGITNSSIVISPTVTTTYSITGALSTDCQVSSQIFVSVVSKPVTVLNTINSICPDTCSGLVNAISNSGTAPFTYSLSTSGIISVPYKNLCKGLYTLYTIDAYGCSNYNIFSIDCLDLSGLNNKNEEGKQLIVYPNPAVDHVTIDIKEKNYIYYVYNSFGQLVSSKSNNSYQVSIDISEFSKGIYMIEVTLGNETLRKKLIVE